MCVNFNSPRFTNQYSHLEITDQLEVEEEVNQLANRIFYIKSQISEDIYNLPSTKFQFCQEIWEDKDLQTLKVSLNAVKNELEVYDIEKWQTHTQYANPGSRLSYFIKNKMKPELLSQAFIKFYEILQKFPMIPNYEGNQTCEEVKFHSLHLCEAPGAFIVALNHYLSLQLPTLKNKWSWMGNTLNPYFEGTPSSQCISDDRFIMKTLPNWFFGKNQTGDIMDPSYMEELIKVYRKKNEKVQIVTADGSIDCQGQPAEQEAMTHRLHLSEVYVALSLLEDGGAFVLKIFTFFESESVNLLYLLSCAFEQVILHKPLGSKMGNSEVYIIALGFQSSKSLNKYLPNLKNFLEAPSLLTMFPKSEIPRKFFQSVRECCNFFNSLQIKAIRRNIDLYENSTQRKKQRTDLMKCFMQIHFSKNCICEPINQDCRLVSKTLEWDNLVYPKLSFKWGEQISKKSKVERLDFLSVQLDKLIKDYGQTLQYVLKESRFVENKSYILYELPPNAQKNFPWNIKVGKNFDTVYISRFCNSVAMKVYHKYLTESVLHGNESLRDNNGLFKYEILNTIKKHAKDKLQIVKDQVDIMANSTIIDESTFVGPHNRCHALEELVSLIITKKLQENQSVVITNAPLFTRLQAGMVYILRNYFSQTYFSMYDQKCDLISFVPVIVFSKYCGVADDNNILKLADNQSVHEVINLDCLVSGRFHAPLCMYNYSYALWNTSIIKFTHSINKLNIGL